MAAYLPQLNHLTDDQKAAFGRAVVSTEIGAGVTASIVLTGGAATPELLAGSVTARIGLSAAASGIGNVAATVSSNAQTGQSTTVQQAATSYAVGAAVGTVAGAGGEVVSGEVSVVAAPKPVESPAPGAQSAAATGDQASAEAANAGPKEPYNRKAMYGKTPTAADRKAVGAGTDEVADHNPPLVQRYYEGDPATGEKPGYQMTPAERKASAGDRSRMQPQPKSESSKQGAQMKQYSMQKKQEHFGNDQGG